MTSIADELIKLAKAFADNTITQEAYKVSVNALVPPPRAADDATTALREYFEASESRRLYAWRGEFEKFLSDKKSIIAEPMETIREAFIEQCKNGMLSPDDMLTLSYLICGGVEDRLLYAGAMLRFDRKERIKTHNFHVANEIGEAFLATHGKTISRMPWPLFPQSKSLAATNLRLLQEASALTGGALEQAPVPSVFRQPPPTGGEYWAPVVSVGENAAVDLTNVEDAVKAMQAEIARLQQQIRNLPRTRAHVDPREGTGRGGQATSALRNNQNNNNRGGFNQRGNFRRAPRGGARDDALVEQAPAGSETRNF